MRVLVLIAILGCHANNAVEPAPRPGVAQVAQIAQITHGLLPVVSVRGEDVRYALEDRMRKYHVHGVSIAVVDHGRLAWAQGFGVADVETGAPVTETTLFQAGSISKSVNALAVLQAVAQGTLALDAPINDALKSWKLADSELTRGAPVTLRELLSHTAGTNVHGFPGYVAGTPVPSLVQVLDGAPPANSARIVVDQPPGKAFRYSGGGITITQLALIDQLGRPYPQLLAERVLGPLGMTRSTYEQPLPPARVAEAAAGYDLEGKVVPGKRNVYPEMAAAGLWTTPSDLARFFLELQRARAGTSRVIPRAIALQMTTAVAPADGQEIGLGVFLWTHLGARWFGHAGADTGFQANVLASLDGDHGLIMMANSDNSFPLFSEIARAVSAAYAWPGTTPAIERVPVDAARLTAMAGRYGTAAAPIAIAVEHGKLVVRRPFTEPAELVPIAGGRFEALDDRAQLERTDAGVTIRRVEPDREEALPRLADGVVAPLFELEAGRFDAAIAAIRALRQADPKLLDEDSLASAAYGARARGNLAGAIELMRASAALAPDSANAAEGLAEVYEAAGNRALAIAGYQRTLALIPRDTTSPREIVRETERAATEGLARLGSTH